MSEYEMKWIEIAADVLTPMSVLLLGLLVHRVTSRLEARHSLTQQLIARRLEVFASVSPLLNRAYCYAVRVGVWRDVEPSALLRLKRDADEIMFSNFPIFGNDVFLRYRELMDSLFVTFQGPTTQARLRLDSKNYRLGNWQEHWADLFAVGLGTNRSTIHGHYVGLMNVLAEQLGVDVNTLWSPPLPVKEDTPSTSAAGEAENKLG